MKKVNSETKIRIYLLIILFFSALYYLLCMVVKNDFFQATTFYDVRDTFMDWFNCVAGYGGNPYAGEVGSNYPALAVLIFKVFRLGIPEKVLDEGVGTLVRYQNAWIIFMVYNGILIWIFSVSVDHKLKLKHWDKMLFFAVCLFSFPVLFAFERGNIINLAFVLTMFFYSFYQDENKVLRELAFMALAIAAGIKIYPAIFGFLLLKRRRIWECVRLSIYGILSFVAPFFWFGGLKAIKSFLNGILGFSLDRSTVTSETMDAIASFDGTASSVTIMPSSYGYNFSLFNICKVIREMLGVHLQEKMFSVGLILISIMLFVTALIIKEEWKELLCYTLMMILIPSFSGAYVMLFMFISFIAYLNHEMEDENQTDKKRLNSVYALTMLLLITPWALPNVSFFSTDIQPGPLTGSYLLYFLCVLVITLLMIYEGLKCLIDKYRKAERTEKVTVEKRI